jgi:hypothetical protein
MFGESDRLYYIHIPKTAGTTLISLLDMHFGIDEICPAQLWRELAELPTESLSAYRLFRGHFGGNGLGHFLPNPPKCITMLRKSIPTALSRYEFILREPGIPVHKLVNSQQMSFSEFVKHPETRPQISNIMVRNLSFDLDTDPNDQAVFPAMESQRYVKKWIKNHQLQLKPEQKLERAKAKLKECVFFGLAERFDESMALMSHTFGWHPVEKIQRLRVSAGRSQRDAIPTGIFREVEELNELDIELYYHAERLFEEKLTAMKSELFALTKAEEGFQRRDMETPEQFNQLLDRHYIRCSCDRYQDLLSSIRYDFSGPLDGMGWHARETAPSDNSFFRWTGPGRRSTLDLELKRGTDLLLTFRIVNTVDLSLLETLCVKVNNHLLKLRTLNGTGTPVRVIQGKIPAFFLDVDRPFTKLVFEVDHVGTLVSKNQLNPDKRKVGIAVNWIDIRPVSQQNPDETTLGSLLNDQTIHPPVFSFLSRIKELFHKIGDVSFLFAIKEYCKRKLKTKLHDPSIGTIDIGEKNTTKGRAVQD